MPYIQKFKIQSTTDEEDIETEEKKEKLKTLKSWSITHWVQRLQAVDAMLQNCSKVICLEIKLIQKRSPREDIY